MRASPSSATQDRFEALLVQHRGLVLKVAGMYARRPEDRQDLVQEIHTQLWRSFGRYDPGRPFPTWMYRVALNVAISYARRATQRRDRMESFDAQRAEPVDESATVYEPDERLRALYRVIDRLGELDRALVLLYLDELSYAEIGTVLGLSDTNVATKLSRLKRRLRDALNPTS